MKKPRDLEGGEAYESYGRNFGAPIVMVFVMVVATSCNGFGIGYAHQLIKYFRY